MYIPRHFEVTNKNEIFTFIESNGFGQLISQLNKQLFATHLPFLLSEDKTKLLGHIALSNPQHQELDGQQVMVILAGPHDYISPSWYQSPGVPTWNYQAVHIYGKCKLLKDREQLNQIVHTLTRKYEAAFESPWQPEFKPAMLNAIVGIEITISDLQCKYKLSQNRTTEDRQQVIRQLEELGSKALADAMLKNE